MHFLTLNYWRGVVVYMNRCSASERNGKGTEIMERGGGSIGLGEGGRKVGHICSRASKSFLDTSINHCLTRCRVTYSKGGWRMVCQERRGEVDYDYNATTHPITANSSQLHAPLVIYLIKYHETMNRFSFDNCAIEQI